MGIKPNQSITAAAGIATYQGGRVYLLGACRLGQKNPKPWGANGKLLDSAKTKQFWHAIDRDPSRPKSIYDSDRDPKAIWMVFAIDGEGFVMTDLDRMKDLPNSVSKHAEKGFPHTQALCFESAAKSLDVFLTVSLKKKYELFRIDLEDEATWPSGFTFASTSSTSSAFRATKEKREDFKIRTYRVTATVPDAFKEVTLSLRADDHDDKNLMMPSIDQGIPGEKIDSSLAGCILFAPSAKERPGYKRTFIMSASNEHTLSFPKVPTQATP